MSSAKMSSVSQYGGWRRKAERRERRVDVASITAETRERLCEKSNPLPWGYYGDNLLLLLRG